MPKSFRTWLFLRYSIQSQAHELAVNSLIDSQIDKCWFIILSYRKGPNG